MYCKDNSQVSQLYNNRRARQIITVTGIWILVKQDSYNTVSGLPIAAFIVS